MEIHPIAKIETDFPEKFGLPRQSGLVEGLRGKIVFEKEYRSMQAVKGLDQYSHIWLLWHFDVPKEQIHDTVRPPRLGGNTRMGVFATRSPFRPNRMGLSCVKLEAVREEESGPVLYVSGVDMRSGTEIYDIKPYLPFADAHPEASEGFAGAVRDRSLSVEIPEHLLEKVEAEKREALCAVLEQDPRPHYQNDPERIYGMQFAGREIRFRVAGEVLTVLEVE